jgi:hypothetical protein
MRRANDTLFNVSERLARRKRVSRVTVRRWSYDHASRLIQDRRLALLMPGSYALKQCLEGQKAAP